MKPPNLIFLLLLHLSLKLHADQLSSILFATLGRATYAFDVYSIPIYNNNNHPLAEVRLTDGRSVNYNGHFPPPTPVASLFPNWTAGEEGVRVVYVTERGGSHAVYLDSVGFGGGNSRRSALQTESTRSVDSSRSAESTRHDVSGRLTESTRVAGVDATIESARADVVDASTESTRSGGFSPSADSTQPDELTSYQASIFPAESTRTHESGLLAESTRVPRGSGASTRSRVILVGNRISGSMKDRPSLVGDYLVYVSTHEDSGVPRTSWAAVYSTHLKTGSTRRLTPYGVADYSPSVSPSGVYTAVASYGAKGWGGEVDELKTDIYVFLTRDGSERVKVVEHGGWPSWVDDSVFYFHRRGEDRWWSVYRATLPDTGRIAPDTVVIQRVTPPGVHAFTPAASLKNKSFLAVATRRPDSEFRHIELFHIVSGTFQELTRLVSPKSHHYNPFVSPDSSRVGYHRCRGDSSLLLESILSPIPGISQFRVDGSFPSFSPDGDRIAYVKFPGVYVMNRDGSGHREVYSGTAFSTGWDWKRKGVVYTSIGPTFASESTKVDIISIDVDSEDLNFKKLTHGGENNAFPSASPDGKWVVFRSGRSGHKNLYIMDSVNGEKGGLRRLTEGPWSDTMCNWSPDGEWIAFASDRETPGSGSFAVYMIHPNGTGLHKLIQSGSGGRANHPWFSPDGQHIVFTSDYAGVSAEPISNPHHFQPYGDIFVIRVDGSDIRRMTHNSYEDGTPAWGPKFMRPVDVDENESGGKRCSFDDCHWLSTSPRGYGLESALNGGKVQCWLCSTTCTL